MGYKMCNGIRSCLLSGPHRLFMILLRSFVKQIASEKRINLGNLFISDGLTMYNINCKLLIYNAAGCIARNRTLLAK